jgi:hypothetical protein
MRGETVSALPRLIGQRDNIDVRLIHRICQHRG